MRYKLLFFVFSSTYFYFDLFSYVSYVNISLTGNIWVIISKDSECVTWGGMVGRGRNVKVRRQTSKMGIREQQKEHTNLIKMQNYGIAN